MYLVSVMTLYQDEFIVIHVQDDSVSQAQIEVQNMLRIIENQTHACKNLSALNNLRRQLTELCGQFSVYLAGGSAADFGTPAVKRART